MQMFVKSIRHRLTGRWRLALAYSLLVASCESPFAPGVVVVGRVEITPAVLQLPVGNTTTIVARVYDESSALLPEARVHWSSQNTSVVSIDQAGVVTAVSPGTAQIAASSGGVSTTIAVTIDERPIALIRVTPPAPSVEPGGTIQLLAEALDGNGTVLSGRPIAWSSNEPTIASVSTSGVVTGLAAGTATISASGEGKVGTATVTVSQAPIATLQISPSNPGLPAGGTLQFTATARDAAGTEITGRQLTWESSNDAVATVAANGLLTAITPGVVTVTVRAPGGGPQGTTPTASTTVTVQIAPVATAAIAPPAATVLVGQSLQLTVNLFDSSGEPLSTAGRQIAWSSTAPTVASVNATGRVTGVGVGTAQLRVKVWTTGIVDTVQATASITVSNQPVVGVTVTPSSATVHVGQLYTRTFVATALGAGGVPLTGRPILWTSSNQSVATVEATSGVVTGVSPGAVQIRATSEAAQGTANVTIDLVPAFNLTINPPAVSLTPTAQQQLSATVRDSAGNLITGAALGGRVANWSTSDPAIATVSTGGLVTAVAPGTATINAVIDGATGQAAITVGITPIATIVVTPSPNTVVAGQTVQLTATALDAVGGTLTGRVMTWASSNPAVATVDQNGLVTAVAAGGPVDITATAEGQVGTAQVTVIPPPAVALGIATQPGASAQSGNTLAPQPQIQLLDASNNPVLQSGVVVTASIASGDPATTLNGTVTATTNASGVAQFVNLALTGAAGSYTLRFAATGLTSVVSNAITLDAGTGSRLEVTRQPSTPEQNGVPFSTQPRVTLKDVSGNTVMQSGVQIFAVIATGGGTLGGTTVATTNGSGTATFVNLSITGTVGPRTLLFSASGYQSVESNAIVLTPGAATQLAVATQPGGAASGASFSTAPVVRLLDSGGNAVSQAGVNVTASISSGGGGTASLIGSATAATDGSGLATFTGLGINGLVGSYTLAFSSGGLTGTSSAAFNLVAGAPTQLTMQVQPGGAASGAAFGTPPAVRLRDAAGNTVSQAGVNVSASLASGGGGSATLLGTASVATDASGVATFNGLGITGPVGPYTLAFASGGLAGATSASFNLAAGAPTQLVMVTQPAGAVSGQAFTTQPAVRLLDGVGNAVSQAGVNVTAAITGGGGGATLNGTTSVATDASGVATFSGLGLTGSAGSYSLDFSAGGLAGTTSASFNLTVNPTQLGMVVQPAGAVSGVALTTQPVVQLLDAGSTPVAVAGVSVTASITGGGGGATLIGTATALTDATGQATFSNLGISGLVGSYSLDFTAAGLAGVTSGSFNLTAGAPTQLDMATEPSGGESGQSFTTQPAVRLRDNAGNPVSQAGVNVTAAITGGGGGATLNGTTTVATDASGVATFSGLGITGPAGSYSLDFTAGGLAGTTSASFNVTVSATQLGMVTEPAGAVNGVILATQPVVQLLNAASSPVAQAGVMVTASITGGGGATLTGTVTVATDGAGQAAFGDLGLTGPSGSYSLDFTAPGLTGVTSASFNLAVGAATQLQVVTDPAGAASGAAFGTQPAVRLLDSGGNPVNQAGVTVTAAITGGGATLLGTNTASTDGTGLATFADLGITGTAATYSLTFTAAGLTDAVSGSFALAVGAPFSLDLVTSPAGAVSGAPFGTQPVVRVLDSGGNQVPQAGISVTASILSGDPSATLNGTAVVATDGTGVAAFGDLGLTGPAGAYEIAFDAPGLASVSVPIGLAFSVQQAEVETGYANVTADRLTTLPGTQRVGNMSPDRGVTVTMAIARQARHDESSALSTEWGPVGDGPGPVCREVAAHEPASRAAPWTSSMPA